MKKPVLSLLLVGLLTIVGCGSDDPEKSFECTAANSACVVIKTPVGFTGTALNLGAFLYASMPPAGPPGAILGQFANPTFTNGEHSLMITDISATGDYFLYLVLYMEGGGTTSPVADVDYVGFSSSAVTFDGSPVNLGEIELALYTQ